MGAAWRVAFSLNDLRSQVNALAPHRSKVSDGTVADAAHASRVSDHNPDASGIVRALDLTDDPKGGLDALWLREALRRSRDPRIKYVISEGQMFSSYPTNVPAWTWRTYVGSNQHTQHVHISVQPGAAGDRPGRWVLTRDLGAPVRPIPDVPEDDMADYAAQLDGIENLLKNVAAQSERSGTMLQALPGVPDAVWGHPNARALMAAAARLDLAALVPVLPGVVGALSDADLQAIATAVADENARRQES